MSDEINDGGSAFPVAPLTQRDNGEYEFSDPGMTLRQYASIKLRVPESGTDWLDEMIVKSNRDRFAGQSLNARRLESGPFSTVNEEMARLAYMDADAMLAAREGETK